MKNKLLLYFGLLAILQLFILPVKAQSTFRNKTIDSLILQNQSYPFNGIVLIHQKDKTLFRKKYGYSDMEKKEPLRFNDRFVIGSVSKQITAVMILQAYEKGLVSLNKPVGPYLPELSASWKDSVTIHHLLTHTHGITSPDKPLAFPPGTQFSYSQSGFYWLSRILENVTGKSFAVLSAELFRKCKMKNSLHPSPNPRLPEYISGYFRTDDGEFHKESHSTENPVAVGSFISTAEDLLRWNQCLHEGKLLSPESYRLMFTAYPNAVRQHPLFGRTEYGYGITLSSENNLKQMGHTGLAPGFVSMNFYFPQSKTHLIILSNMENSPDNISLSFEYHTRILDYIHNELQDALQK